MKAKDPMSRELRQIDQFVRSLAKVTDIRQVKGIRDRAEALRHFAEVADLGLKAQNRFAVAKLRAERRAGELLTDIVKRGGNRRSKSRNHEQSLANLGIDWNRSSRWQREAAVPEDVFEKYVAEANSASKEITAQGLLHLTRSRAAKLPTDYDGKCTTPDDVALSSKGDTQAKELDSVEEILEEFQNHRNLLEQILKPLWSGKSDEIQPADQRMALRLLREMHDLHVLLVRIWRNESKIRERQV
jgi:hypothetical protein